VTARRSSTWALLASSLRPGQWTKNLLLFVGLIFGGRLLDPDAIAAALLAFAIFCALSGADIHSSRVDRFRRASCDRRRQ
jgi:4-hydroxybenzoate polyprenyltransferase